MKKPFPCFEMLHGTCQPAINCCLGVDLVKESEVLHAAYNDSAGVTASFNKNLLSESTANSAATSTRTLFPMYHSGIRQRRG